MSKMRSSPLPMCATCHLLLCAPQIGFSSGALSPQTAFFCGKARPNEKKYVHMDPHTHAHIEIVLAGLNEFIVQPIYSDLCPFSLILTSNLWEFFSTK